MRDTSIRARFAVPVCHLDCEGFAIVEHTVIGGEPILASRLPLCDPDNFSTLEVVRRYFLSFFLWWLGRRKQIVTASQSSLRLNLSTLSQVVRGKGAGTPCFLTGHPGCVNTSGLPVRLQNENSNFGAMPGAC